jgi:GH24 family phage-related lysozyme (muramidase)
MVEYTLTPIAGNPFANEAPQDEAGVASAALQGAAQGASLGFGEEMLAGLAAPVAGAGLTLTNLLGVTDVEAPFQESYENILQRQRKGIAKAREDQPAAFLGGEIAGAIGTGIAGGATRGAQAVGNLAAKAALPTKAGRAATTVAKRAVPAGTSGYAYGFGAAEGGLTQRQKEAEKVAALSAALGIAAPLVIKPLSKSVLATKEKFLNNVKNLSADDIGVMANRAYNKANELGGTVKSKVTDSFIDKVNKASSQTGIGKAVAGENTLTKLAKRLDDFKGKKLTLNEVQEIDEALGDLIDSEFDLTGLSKQGKKLVDIQSDMRAMISEGSDALFDSGAREGFDALKEGRRLYSRKMAMQDIERIINRANRFEQPATAIKTGFRAIADNKKKLRGFTGEEKRLIKRAAETGVVADAFKTFGSRLNPIGSFAATGDPGVALAMKAGGDVSRQAAALLQARKAGDITREISRNVQGLSPIKGIESTFPTAQAAISESISGDASTSDVQLNQPQPSLTPVDFNPFEESAAQQSDLSTFTMRNEGFSPTVYTDTQGFKTVGHGLNMQSGIARKVWKDSGIDKDFGKVLKGQESITPQESAQLMRTSMRIATEDAMKYYGDGFEDLSPQQVEGLVDLSYQLGLPKLNKFTSLRNALKRKNKAAIVRVLKNSKLGKQTPERAQRQAQLLASF